MKKSRPQTPDGRYFVSKDQLWRCTDPRLPDGDRRRLIKTMMQARVAMKNAVTDEEINSARSIVNDAKTALGERGPVWWDDGAPDLSGRRPEETIYAAWWAELRRDVGDNV